MLVLSDNYKSTKILKIWERVYLRLQIQGCGMRLQRTVQEITTSPVKDFKTSRLKIHKMSQVSVLYNFNVKYNTHIEIF